MSDVSYDLIELNGVAVPDVKKGSLSVGRNPKYNEYETEGGGKVIEIIEEKMLKGSVSFNGLFQSEIQTIEASISTVSEMTIYNPLTNTTRSFMALITTHDSEKKIHDARANVWSYGFDFEEIGDIPED